MEAISAETFQRSASENFHMFLKCLSVETVLAFVLRSGSAPLSPWLIEGWKDRYGIEIANIFGSNEGASLFSNQQSVPDPVERARYFPRFGARDAIFLTRLLLYPALNTEIANQISKLENFKFRK